VKLSPAQRWILGCHPVLTEVNGGRHDVLGMFERPRESGRALNRLRTWSLETRAQVLERLEWLNIHGESRELDAVLESPERAAGEGAERLRAAVVEHEHVLRRARFLAWDLGRLAAIAGWAYAAYLLDTDAAWTWMRAAAVRLQATYESWDELIAHYALARGIYVAGDDRDTASAVARLREGLAPTWRPPDWRTDLGQVESPAPPRRTWRVSRTGKADARELGAVLEKVADGDRIVLRPGKYRGVEVERSVEIAGEGNPDEIIIEQATDGPCILTSDVGLVLEGVTLRARTTKKGARHAVETSGNFLRLVGCTLQSDGAAGLRIDFEDGQVQLERCTIKDCGTCAILAEDGRITAEECTFAGSVETLVQVRDVGRAAFYRCAFRDGAAAGIVASGSTIHLASCSISGCGFHALTVQDGADATVLMCRIEDCDGAGLQVRHARVHVERSRFRDNAGAGIACLSGAVARFESCEVQGGNESAVLITALTEPVFVDCTIQGSGLACVAVQAGARAHLAGCTMRGSKTGSGIFVQKADAQLLDCDITDNALGGVEVRDYGHARLEHSRVHRNRTRGVLVHEAGRAHFVDCEIAQNEGVGVFARTHGAATFERVLVAKNASMGISAAEDSFVRFAKGLVIANRLSGLDASTHATIEVEDSRVSRNDEAGLLVREDAVGRARRCVFSGNDNAGVRVDAAMGWFEDCEMRDGRYAGVAVLTSGSPRFVRCAVDRNQESGVEIQGGAAPTFLTCRITRTTGDDVAAHASARGTFVDCVLGGASEWTVDARTSSAITLRRTKVHDSASGLCRIDETSTIDLQRGSGQRVGPLVVAERESGQAPSAERVELVVTVPLREKTPVDSSKTTARLDLDLDAELDGASAGEVESAKEDDGIFTLALRLRDHTVLPRALALLREVLRRHGVPPSTRIEQRSPIFRSIPLEDAADAP
jgi:hypothetical protein